MTNKFNKHDTAQNMSRKISADVMQQWNRAIPESDYIQLGTLRYGIRLSNQNLLNPNLGTEEAHRGTSANVAAQAARVSINSCDNSTTNGSSNVSTGGNSSNSSSATNKVCCCVGSGALELPWNNNNYARTRLPVPNTSAKNRKSSPSASASSSASRFTHPQQLHSAQKQISTEQASKGKLQYNSQPPKSFFSNNRNNSFKKDSAVVVGKPNLYRETSHASFPTVCCYSKRYGSTFNNNAKNNNLVKVSNKYSDSKKLKILNNKSEPKTAPSSEDNQIYDIRKGTNLENFSNSKHLWSEFSEHGAAKSAQHLGEFPTVVRRKDVFSSSENSVKRSVDGNDLNLNLRNASPLKEAWPKDVNINNLKIENLSNEVYYGPNSSVSSTRYNNKRAPRKNTVSTSADVCVDKLSSVTLSARLPLSSPPLQTAAESWSLEDSFEHTASCVPVSSPVDTNCTQTSTVPPSPTDPCEPALRASAYDALRHICNESNDHHLSCIDRNNKSVKNRTAGDREESKHITDFRQNVEEDITFKNDIPQFEYTGLRKSSLPVINHEHATRTQPRRKLSSDIISTTANACLDGSSAVVICHVTPKFGPSVDQSDVETRLQSLNRYCAQNLNPCSNSSELEEFSFIDSSDFSSTGEDITVVISEENNREYQKYHSIPKRNISVNEVWNSISAPAQITNYYVGCSSDELSSVCNGGESIPAVVINEYVGNSWQSTDEVNSAKHIKANKPFNPNCKENQNQKQNEQFAVYEREITSSVQKDSNNNQHAKDGGKELKCVLSNNSSNRFDGDENIVFSDRGSSPVESDTISADSAPRNWNFFGKNQLYARISPEKIMEKRNNTLDRLQKLVKKTTSGSNERSNDKHGTKTERLRELTELLKGSRAPPIPPPRRAKNLQTIDRNLHCPHTAASTTSLLNIDTIHSIENRSNLKKTKESRSIDIPYQFTECNQASTPSSPLTDHKVNLRANVSTSNLECLQSTSTKDSKVEEAKSVTSFRDEDDIFCKLPKPESRTIVGSYTQKTIPFRSASFSQVDYSSGKYIRSALGAIKNSLLRGKDNSVMENTPLPKENATEFTRSCSPAQFFSTSESDSVIDDNEVSRTLVKKTELNINLYPPDTFERCDGLDGRELSSNRNSDIETIVEDPEAEHIETIGSEVIEQQKAEISVNQASEMVLESLTEEGIPITPQSSPKDEECLQQATTCIIPVPVYDCVVSEWSTARPSEQWIDAAATECSKFVDSITITKENEAVLSEPSASIINELVVDKLPDSVEPFQMNNADSADINTHEMIRGDDIATPPISIVCTEPDSLVSTTIIETLPTPDEPLIRLDSTGVVEVRKRHSNNEENGDAMCNYTSEIEEKRRIDKSKRRKGIYIQWPAIDTNIDPESDSNDNYTPDDSWRPDKLTIEKDSSLDLSGESFTDLSTKDITSSPEKSKETELFHRTDPILLDPNTPDSDISRPSWPKGSRRQSLTYQSSDEKDDSIPLTTVPVRSFRNLFMRSDSVSDNESERASSRDRTSASPAPVGGDHDLKRYSKRPLRGPYGQMLEAEMKKPSKVHYNEILEELSKHESSHSFPSFSRNRGSGSQSMDETNDRHSSKIFKPRKASANLPLPAHSRTASSPSKLADMSNIESHPLGNTKRHLGNIDQKSTDSDRSEKSNGKIESKKFSLDSHLSEKSSSHDKHSKRSSSGTSDKHQKRSLDDTRYSHSSRTPSERSSVLNTPDTQKNLVASPELLAELLKGSSEKLVTEQLTGGTSPGNGNNALPTAVLKYLDTRTHVVVELFNTEKSYVESLQTIVLKYLNQLKSPENSGLVDTQTVDEIFFMVPAILNIHERFLEELRRRLDAWDPLQKIGDAFVDVFSRPVILDTYTSFVNNWNRAKDAIRITRQKCPAFARFLEAMAREHKGKLSLDNLLIKPVQKFPNYELILSRLIKHTNVDHPDQKLLQEALKLVHDILVFLNCKEKEALENGQRENALRELEGVIEGISDLVTPDRAFLLFDLVSMPSGQATRKERGFFLFNDLLVITSIKRRSGTIRKTNLMCPGSVASTLDTNKYKFLTKITLDELEIVKSKDENVRRIMKEIEHLSEDSNKLSQMSELASSLRSPHQLLEEAIRDLQREVQRQLSERQTNDAQLNILELTLNSSSGIQNMTAVFSKPDKRAQWEETFTEAKQKLASTVQRCQIPEFLLSVPIRKTRAGLQFTCASPTLGIQRDVWVCNSDGYVGQVCVLSLVPEPTVTSCNGVCNARILCVASVPAADISCYNHSDTIAITQESPSIATTINSIVNSSSKPREKRTSKTGDESIVSNEKISKNIQLDSDSSSEESEAESQPENTINPAAVPATSNLPIIHRQQESNTEEADVQQSTMWLGTEDGCIHVYNCTDNIRIKKNKIKIPHISAVYSILYLNNQVFVSLANGDVCVYSRDQNGWNTTAPFTVSVGTVTNPVTKLLNVHGKLWCAIQGCIKVLNTVTLQVDDQIQISNDSKPVTNMAVLNEYVWISVQNSAHIKCCHHESFEIIFEVNLAPSVNKMLSNCDDIIRQHKAACLRVTSLLACKDLIWVGTSAGVLLTIAASTVCKGSSIPAVIGIPHGHTGHVRFLTSVDTPDSDDFPKALLNKSISSNGKLNLSLLVISGGDGYEDFRGTGNNTMSEIAGREDSTNHLLLWQV
ncbi:uncharacterized protein LOC129732498 [Wyeomyia smithii]|uniref:uncharacterized protein LOC129732498 n=1 Tax=Wyeomyia smithii TaxID=174621 RepID=UPI002467E602|nr:uncharacterized protein LOC129732498 [Wyeomyia smithii]